MENYGIVSVIVPIYNVEKYLQRCVRSIQDQTYPYLEIILVDDGSPDNCGMLCDEYAKDDERIKVIHKTNAGLGMARNSGLDLATGEFVVFIDSDDYVNKSYVETLLKSLIECNADMSTVGYIRKFADGSEIFEPSVSEPLFYSGSDVIEKVFLPIIGALPENAHDVEQDMCVWRNLYRRSIIERLNLRFVSEREYVSEDIFFNMEYLLNAHSVVKVPSCVYYYSENTNSLTHTYREDRYEKYCKMLLKQVKILQERNVFELAKLRLYRTFIMKCKKCISMIAKSDNNWCKKKKLCRDILNDCVFSDVVRAYDVCVKNGNQKIQLFLLKNRMVWPLLMYYFLK